MEMQASPKGEKKTLTTEFTIANQKKNVTWGER